MQERIEQSLNRDTAEGVYRRLKKAARRAGNTPLVVSFDATVELDSVGAATLSKWYREARKMGVDVRFEGLGEQARQVLAMFEALPDELAHKKMPGFFEHVGDGVAAAAREGLDFLVLTADTLAFAATSIFQGRFLWRRFLTQAVEIGLNALPIVALISFLVGLTVALQAAYQLRQFGANIYIANMVGVAMLSEMGPLMTAILMAGRSGSSIAAEVATMTMAEEMDALRTMGVNPIRYVLVPKMYALVLTQPLLTMMANIVGIFGGLLVAFFYLDISIPAFWNQLLSAVTMKDLLTGLFKSVVFAGIIGLVSAHVGFRTTGGAAGVGRSTTRSVVASIFLVIVADAVFSLIFYFGD